MDRSEVYEHARSKGWVLVNDGDYGCVYRYVVALGGGVPPQHKYLYVMFGNSDEYNYNDTRLVMPHKGEILGVEQDDEGALLRWWLDGNEGSDDAWWNQLSKEEQDALA